jgi:hypothetical protein
MRKAAETLIPVDFMIGNQQFLSNIDQTRTPQEQIVTSVGFYGCGSHAKEKHMHRGYRLVSSLLLTAALAAPVAVMAATPRDDKDRDHDSNQSENHKRYYDKRHKDYHTWDGNEDRSYQRYQTERHETRPFIQLNTRQQSAYWGWRHDNPDNR